MVKNVLIIDGDLIAYRMAAGGEVRSILVTHKPSNKSKKFSNRTEFKKFLEEKKFDYAPEDYEIKDQQDPVDFNIVKKSIRNIITKMNDFCFADQTEIYLGSSNITLREKLPLPNPYKNNREGIIKPHHLINAKDYIVKAFGAKYEEQDLEADDMVTIRSYEELAKGNRPILASTDKDARQCTGIELLVWTDDDWKLYKIPEIGDLRKEGSTIKGEGLKFLAYQTLAGDPTDTYQPYKLSDISYGPTAAYKSLSDKNSPKAIFETVIREYKRLYPQPFYYNSWNDTPMLVDWKFMLQMYWRCSYMKRSRADDSRFWTFVKQYDIEEENY